MKRIVFIFCVISLVVQTALAQVPTVLCVMSAADTLALDEGAKLRQTGVFLNEFYEPYKAIIGAGYRVAFATPAGKVATIDGESIQDKYWKEQPGLQQEALEFVDTNPDFLHPLSLKEALESKEQYVGLLIPGGQGLMVDLVKDVQIPLLLSHFAEADKPTGLICHAPALLLSFPEGENPFAGFRLTCVSPMEEFVIENFIMKGKPERRKIGKQLKRAGMDYKRGLPKANFAVKDRNLVTSQNPFSSPAFSQLFLSALKEYEEAEKEE